MRKPVTPPPKPPRVKLARPTDEEEAAIQRGIAADPDNPEWTAKDIARARPFSELVEKKRRGRSHT